MLLDEVGAEDCVCALDFAEMLLEGAGRGRAHAPRSVSSSSTYLADARLNESQDTFKAGPVDTREESATTPLPPHATNAAHGRMPSI